LQSPRSRNTYGGFFLGEVEMKLAAIRKELLLANLKNNSKKIDMFRQMMFDKIAEYKAKGKKFRSKHILK